MKNRWSRSQKLIIYNREKSVLKNLSGFWLKNNCLGSVKENKELYEHGSEQWWWKPWRKWRESTKFEKKNQNYSEESLEQALVIFKLFQRHCRIARNRSKTRIHQCRSRIVRSRSKTRIHQFRSRTVRNRSKKSHRTWNQQKDFTSRKTTSSIKNRKIRKLKKIRMCRSENERMLKEKKLQKQSRKWTVHNFFVLKILWN